MTGDGLDDLLVDLVHLTGHAKGAIGLESPCPPSDLGQFVGHQIAHAAPIKFAQARKRDVTHIEVQTHADRICRHEEIDFAILVQINLRVARAWAERAHDNRASAPLATDQFRDCVEIIDRETDDRRARDHPAQLLGAGIGQLRKPLAPAELNARHLGCNRPAHRIRTQKQGFVQTARIQQPVGEDMPALGIRTELNFIDRKKIRPKAHRHRLNGAHPVLHPFGDDTLLPSHKRHNGWPTHLDDPVIDFARQQTQGQADHTGAIGQHPLDGVVGFSGVCRAQNSRDLPARSAAVHAVPAVVPGRSALQRPARNLFT